MDNKVKKSTQYEDFGHSKQTFDQVRRIEAFNGDIILRGQRGERDHAYPLAKACKRFSRMYMIYSHWLSNGFATQCEQLRLVLIELGRLIQEAVAQRLSGKTTEPPPSCCDAKFMAQLEAALKLLDH